MSLQWICNATPLMYGLFNACESDDPLCGVFLITTTSPLGTGRLLDVDGWAGCAVAAVECCVRNKMSAKHAMPERLRVSMRASRWYEQHSYTDSKLAAM